MTEIVIAFHAGEPTINKCIELTKQIEKFINNNQDDDNCAQKIATKFNIPQSIAEGCIINWAIGDSIKTKHLLIDHEMDKFYEERKRKGLK